MSNNFFNPGTIPESIAAEAFTAHTTSTSVQNTAKKIVAHLLDIDVYELSDLGEKHSFYISPELILDKLTFHIRDTLAAVRNEQERTEFINKYGIITQLTKELVMQQPLDEIKLQANIAAWFRTQYIKREFWTHGFACDYQQLEVHWDMACVWLNTAKYPVITQEKLPSLINILFDLNALNAKKPLYYVLRAILVAKHLNTSQLRGRLFLTQLATEDFVSIWNAVIEEQQGHLHQDFNCVDLIIWHLHQTIKLDRSDLKINIICNLLVLEKYGLIMRLLARRALSEDLFLELLYQQRAIINKSILGYLTAYKQYSIIATLLDYDCISPAMLHCRVYGRKNVFVLWLAEQNEAFLLKLLTNNSLTYSLVADAVKHGHKIASYMLLFLVKQQQYSLLRQVLNDDSLNITPLLLAAPYLQQKVAPFMQPSVKNETAKVAISERRNYSVVIATGWFSRPTSVEVSPSTTVLSASSNSNPSVDESVLIQQQASPH